MPDGERAEESRNLRQMTFMGHLMELRTRLIICFAAITVCAGTSLLFSTPLFGLICKPLNDYNLAVAKKHEVWLQKLETESAEIDEKLGGLPEMDASREALNGRLQEIRDLILGNPEPRPVDLAAEGPQSGFMAVIKIGLWAGLLLSLPIIITQLWSFVSPGLLERERKAITPIFIFGIVFFLAGTLIAYRIVIPMALTWLFQFNADLGLAPLTYIRQYVNFVIMLMLAFGVAFEMPLVVLGLSIVGLVTPKILIKQGRYAILAAFVLGAVLTPPDWISQVLMAGCLIGLYGVSILFSYVVVRRREAQAAEDDAADASDVSD